MAGRGVAVVATTEEATAYHVADGRSLRHVCDLVEEDFDGTVVRAGWASLPGYEAAA